MSKTEVVFSNSSSNLNQNNSSIEISTLALDDGDLVYKYMVSGGKIIGSGAKVIWDLSGVKAGTYKITAGVDGGAGVIGITITKVIKVIECPNCI